MTTIREVSKPLRFENDAAVLDYARAVAERGVVGEKLGGPAGALDFLRIRFAGKEREEFIAVYVSGDDRVLGVETLSIGTLDQTAGYPREVARGALKVNAAGVVVAHNHPQESVATPSDADIENSKILAAALDLVGVRLLDSFVVAGTDVASIGAIVARQSEDGEPEPVRKLRALIARLQQHE